MSNTDWNVTKSIMVEVEQLFSRDDDVRDIRDVKKMSREIEHIYQTNFKDAKEIIKAMTARVAAKEAEVAAPSQGDHLRSLQELANDKENLERSLNVVREVVDSKRTNITQLAAKSHSLKEQADELAVNKQMADSRTAYAVSLYSTVSGINWDYTTPDHQLAGYIACDQRKEFYQFSVDTRTTNSLEVADALWETIGRAAI